MKQLLVTGRILYGMGIAAVGIHQVIMRAFRPEILPAWPAWPHHLSILPILAGIILAIAGIMIMAAKSAKTPLYLGIFFLILIVTCHLPYMLFFSAGRASSLAGWFDICETMAYAGGAFVIAGIYPGRILFAILMIVFGCSHFVYPDAVAKMVPSWAGVPMFWTYFVGVALIGAGIVIVINRLVQPVAILLAIMLFGFFLFFHIPDAIQNPSVGHGNEIVRALVCLIFCGIALCIAVNSNKSIENLRVS